MLVLLLLRFDFFTFLLLLNDVWFFSLSLIDTFRFSFRKKNVAFSLNWYISFWD